MQMRSRALRHISVDVFRNPQLGSASGGKGGGGGRNRMNPGEGKMGEDGRRWEKMGEDGRRWEKMGEKENEGGEKENCRMTMKEQERTGNRRAGT